MTFTAGVLVGAAWMFVVLLIAAALSSSEREIPTSGSGGFNGPASENGRLGKTDGTGVRPTF